MALSRVMNTLMLFLIAVLVAGCTSSQSAVNGTSIDTLSTTKVPTTATNEPFTTIPTIQEQCLTGKNKTPCITIDPVGNRYLGDLIKINGTTNCDTGKISIWIKDTRFIPCMKTPGRDDFPGPCDNGITLTAPIILGIDGNNAWSIEVNTSQHHFYPGNFYLFVNDPDCTPFSPVFGYLNITTVPHLQYNSSVNVSLNRE